GELVAELEALAAKHPLRERLRAQLMLALYRSGRQAEALRVYGETRRRLVTELGLEPGQALQQLEQAILRQDPALSVGAAHARRRRRRSMMTAGALALAAVAAAAGVLLFHGGPASLHAQALAQPDSVGLLAADTGKIVGEATVDAPILSRFGEGSLWTLSFTGALTRIDPASGRTLARLSTRVLVPCGLATGERSVWVIDCNTPTLVRIDPSLDPPVAERIRVPTPEPGLATQTEDVVVGAGSVWVGQGFANPSYVHR